MSLYYEIHVTIAYPEWPDDLDMPIDVRFYFLRMEAKRLYGFHMGDLFMLKNSEPSQRDVFFTGRAFTRLEAEMSARDLVLWLRSLGHTVTRYKIEDTVLDSKITDELGLLS